MLITKKGLMLPTAMSTPGLEGELVVCIPRSSKVSESGPLHWKAGRGQKTRQPLETGRVAGSEQRDLPTRLVLGGCRPELGVHILSLMRLGARITQMISATHHPLKAASLKRLLLWEQRAKGQVKHEGTP